MRFIRLLFVISLLVNSLLVVSMASDEKHHVEYFAQYRVNNMFCAFKVNGISYQASPSSGIPKLFSFGGTIGSALAEGENTIGIKGFSVASEALPNTYCEMLVSVASRNPNTGEIESHKVTDIRLTVDENGNFTVEQSGDYGDSSITSSPRLEILKEISLSDQIETDKHDVLVTRQLKINHQHNHHYQWTAADKFTDTPENREKLWQKYEAMIDALNRGDFVAYQAHLEPGALESDHYKSDPETRGFTNSIIDGVKSKFKPDIRVEPYNRDDYDLHVFAEGRLFRFIAKDDILEITSPIAYNGYTFNYTFTMIEGKIVGAYL